MSGEEIAAIATAIRSGTDTLMPLSQPERVWELSELNPVLFAVVPVSHFVDRPAPAGLLGLRDAVPLRLGEALPAPLHERARLLHAPADQALILPGPARCAALCQGNGAFGDEDADDERGLSKTVDGRDSRSLCYDVVP